jgi:hypothetical protein
MNKLLAKITLWWNGYCLKCFEAKDSFLSSECWVCKRDRKNRERERERDRYEERYNRIQKAISALKGDVTNV